MISYQPRIFLQLNRRASAFLRASAIFCLAAFSSVASAQENAIQAITASQQGANIIVRVSPKIFIWLVSFSAGLGFIS